MKEVDETSASGVDLCCVHFGSPEILSPDNIAGNLPIKRIKDTVTQCPALILNHTTRNHREAGVQNVILFTIRLIYN